MGSPKNTSMIKSLAPLFLAATFSTIGCSVAVPAELVDARTAFQRAQQSDAPRMAPAELRTAQESLAKAEESFRNDQDDPRARNLAYIAQRKSEFAVVQAQLVSATQAKENASKGLLDVATQTAEERTAQLQKTQGQLGNERQAREEADRRRVEAEKRLRDAMSRLSAIAAVKEEPRGLVITLPGGVLFESNKSVLLGTAQEKLNQVADALLQNREATMVVEGHTDSQGDDASNQTLSESRAKSVRDYLVTRGIAEDRIRSLGHGKTRPIADNKSPEGRANNRRVEIVVTGANKDMQARP